MTDYVATSGQPVNGVTLNSGDMLYVSSGGTASGIIIDTGGSEQVAADGTAAATTVNAGGSATISLGGVANGVVDSSGGTVVFTSPVLSGAMFTSIGYGQTFSGVTELAGATVELINPAITGQFTLDIASGGVVVNAALTGGGSLTVQGGDSFADNVGAGFEQVFSGLASGSMVSGGNEFVYGGVASGTSLIAGSTQLVGSFITPGSAVQTSLISSTEVVRGGVADGTIVGSGALQVFDEGTGSASGTILNSGGIALVTPGAVFLNPVSNGGTVISSGVALVSNLFTEAAAPPVVAIETGQNDAVGQSQVEFVLASGAATSSVVNGQQSVFSGGVATGTIVTSDGEQNVYTGGQATSAMVNGGFINILGGTATGMVLFNYADAAVVSGNANATVISSTADFLVETVGTASGTIVSSGGVIEVISGGVASATQIGFGGSATISKGGQDNFAQVASGGIDIVYSGGLASGAVISSGGTLSLQTSGQASGTQLQQRGAIILQNFAVSSGGMASFNYATDVLTVTEGAESYTQTLSGNYAGEYFHAAAASTDASATQVTVDTTACYCPGTLIQTNRGEMPVDVLAIGDTVVTASGQHRPIKWIGNRSYAGRFLARNPTVHPIRFRARDRRTRHRAGHAFDQPHRRRERRSHASRTARAVGRILRRLTAYHHGEQPAFGRVAHVERHGSPHPTDGSRHRRARLHADARYVQPELDVQLHGDRPGGIEQHWQRDPGERARFRQPGRFIAVFDGGRKRAVDAHRHRGPDRSELHAVATGHHLRSAAKRRHGAAG